MYEEIVSALRNCGFPNSYRYCPNCVFAGKYGGSCDLKKLLPEAADAIEELSRLHEAQRQNLITLMNEEPETEWIPVTERLPEAHKEVYVTDGEYIERANLLDEVFLGDQPCWSYSGLGEITHWCEKISLPEPPKEET